MKKPTLYKKISLDDVKKRETFMLSDAEKTNVNNVVYKFFELFKQKHLY